MVRVPERVQSEKEVHDLRCVLRDLWGTLLALDSGLYPLVQGSHLVTTTGGRGLGEGVLV